MKFFDIIKRMIGSKFRKVEEKSNDDIIKDFKNDFTSYVIRLKYNSKDVNNIGE